MRHNLTATPLPGRFLVPALWPPISSGRPAVDRLPGGIDMPVTLALRAVEAMAIGLVITDATRSDNPVIYCNPGFERLTGYTYAEVLGRNCRFLQGPDADPAELARLRKAVEEGQACSVVLRNYRKDGTAFWNALSVTPLTDSNGRLTHFVGVQTDITPVKNLEAQFLQAQKMEVMGLLASGIAHDFNNVLTVINGYTDVAMGTLPEGHAARALLEEVSAAGQRAAGMTRQVLGFSRKSTADSTRADLTALIYGCKQMLGKLVGPGIELVTNLAPGLPPVAADPSQVEQVVMNLTINARDAMPTGGRITITTALVEVGKANTSHPGVPPGGYAVMRVADNGCGMDATTLDRVFEPFFTTKPAGRGTGLGLSTVLTIVNGGGGHIRAESEPGEGSTFHVYLPLAKGPTPVSARATPAAMLRGTEVVLVVDDDRPVRGLITFSLRSLGYTVLEAGDGAEALAVVAAHPRPMDLIVCDVMMPGLPTGELVDRLQATNPSIHILFVSGYSEVSARTTTAVGSPASFLQKPFTPTALAAKVRSLLDGE